LIDLNPISGRKIIINKNTCEKYNIYKSGEDVTGEVKFMLSAQNFSHNGIKVELCGNISTL
jgi:hypothetical protein